MKPTVFSQSWPIDGNFTISRGSRTEAHVVICTLESQGKIGRGECTPYARYNETIEGVMVDIKATFPKITPDFTRKNLQALMPAGAARNAIDCALWDLECKMTNSRPIEQEFPNIPEKLITAYTISVASPEEMAAKTRQNSHRKLLKIKLAGDGDIERMKAIREAAPDTTLIVDANEAWPEDKLSEYFAAAKASNIAMIEQPLPSDKDSILADIERTVPIFADESLHTIEDLPKLKARYDGINIKLDKSGGLTEAITLKREAQTLGFQIMVGCMVSSSLSMAPAYYLASDVQFVDLDGPLLLARDCEHGMRYDNNHIFAPTPDLWG